MPSSKSLLHPVNKLPGPSRTKSGQTSPQRLCFLAGCLRTSTVLVTHKIWTPSQEQSLSELAAPREDIAEERTKDNKVIKVPTY